MLALAVAGVLAVTPSPALAMDLSYCAGIDRTHSALTIYSPQDGSPIVEVPGFYVTSVPQCSDPWIP